MHNLLSGDAKRFYLDRVDGYATSYQQAIDLIENEYNSPVRQARVKNYVKTLRISTFTREDLDEGAALWKIYKVITKLSRQGPSLHRGDARKVEFLRNAVVWSGWSHEPLSRVATHGLSFQQLYGELEAAFQLQKEAKQATLRDAATRTKDLGEDDVPGILFTGQTRYAKHPSRNRFFRSSVFARSHLDQDQVSILLPSKGVSTVRTRIILFETFQSL